MYIQDASRMEKLAGHALPGVGALRLERIILGLLPFLGLLVLALLTLLGGLILVITSAR